MPKQTLNINKFEGGMNTVSDPRDIAENQLALLSGCYVDKRGIIRTSGAKAAEGCALREIQNDDYIEGAGFYSFGADYEWDGTQNSDAYFHVIGQGEHFYVYDGDDDAWETTASGVSDGTAVNKWRDDDKGLQLGETSKVLTEQIYHFANNALRISDAYFLNTTNSTQWIGAIDRTLFRSPAASGVVYHTGSGWAESVASKIVQTGWFIEDQYIRPPFSLADCGDGNARNIWWSDGSNITDHDHGDHWPTALHGGSVSFTVQVSTNGTISESVKTTWYIGVSYVYDGDEDGCDGQESNITTVKMESDDYVNAQQFNFSAYEYPAMIMPHFTREHDQGDNYYWNPRVTGMRIYISEKDTGPSEAGKGINTSTWLRIADIDMTNGRWKQFCHGTNNVSSNNSLKAIGDTDASTAHQIVTANNAVGNYLGSATTQTILWGICLAELPAESYYSLNGYKEGSLIDVKYKTSTILNRSTYIGNVYDVTNSQTYGDRIMKTPAGKYDTFSLNFFIDVVPGDGDSIVKLEAFGDRLFVFKERALYIVNVSQGDEFIEGEYQGMGIDKRHHAIKSEYGILWINKNGVFHFDGSKINNLSDNLIKSDWEDFFNTNSSIGYNLQSKHLIIDCDVKSATGEAFTGFGLTSEDSNHGHALVYDFKVKAWTFLNGYFNTDEDRSNMVISSKDQKLMWYQLSETEAVNVYNDTSSAQTIAIHTKDFDFGNPAIRKKIYKVYVSYKGDANAVTCTYAVNGDTNTVANFYKSGADGTTTGATDSTTPFHSSGVGVDDWVRAELKPVASINNIFSFALQFGGTAEADFQINDITIVYRIKNVK
tara:strand:- start:5838 stop:8315 length:2478 start_codon:yes stop_codon:yes gene_type:complete